MGLFTDKFRADLGEMGLWNVTYRQFPRREVTEYTFMRDGEIVFKETRPLTVASGYTPEVFDLPDGWQMTVGYVTLTKLAVEFRKNGTLIHRTRDKPWREAGKLDKTVEDVEMKVDKMAAKSDTPEQQAMLQRQKELWPSIIVDISFGVMFFFVAREFGLVTAALTGAGATLVLFAIQPFVKWNLLGGFAVFGVVMSLISAGIAWGFQDDLAVKLRGTFMAMIGASFALYDAIILKGGYLGKRMAMYMEGLGKINPRRSSFALAGATLLLMAIDTPLAFILTTDQWIWYNSVFDNFIAIPIVIGAMMMAREKKPSAGHPAHE